MSTAIANVRRKAITGEELSGFRLNVNVFFSLR